ncbi:protein of unknown function [Clostridium beijerinckii]|nr:protein of unknown function [Clostridium beijerinckii]
MDNFIVVYFTRVNNYKRIKNKSYSPAKFFSHAFEKADA